MLDKMHGFEVEFSAIDPNFHNIWTEFSPSSTKLLQKGWKRDADRRALREDMIWEKDVAITMRDGIRLYADIFRPASRDGSPLPTILAWSPYGKTGAGFMQTTNFTWVGVPKHNLSGLEKFEGPDPAEWCPRGYVIVNIDSRGAFNSEGNMVVFGTQEGKDGYDTIEWIANQKWSNGSVGMAGNSYLATIQWFIAAEQPPHLKAIAPWEGLGDYFREKICRGGIPNPLFWEVLMKNFNGKYFCEDTGRNVEKYPLMNAYWEDKNPKLIDIKIPIYVLASYSTGLHTEGSIRGWKYSSSPKKWLRIHASQEWHDIYQPSNNDDLQRFFDRYLLNKDNGWESTPKVRLSLLRYNMPPILSRAEDTYPPSRVKYETLFLDAVGGICRSDVSLVAAGGSTSYQSDSWDDDGAHFTFKFHRYTELIGFSKARLYMSCADLDDMDVYVVIRKLDKDGQVLLNYNIPLKDQPPGTKLEDIPDENIYKYVGPNGRLRGSMRAMADDPGLSEEMRDSQSPTEIFYPHYHAEKILPGVIVPLDIGIWPGGIVFEDGESLRFEVKGHDPILPEFSGLIRGPKNQNKGLHNIHTGGEYPSFVLIPLSY